MVGRLVEQHAALLGARLFGAGGSGGCGVDNTVQCVSHELVISVKRRETYVVVYVLVLVVTTIGRLICLVLVTCLAVVVTGPAVTGGGVDVVVEETVV